MLLMSLHTSKTMKSNVKAGYWRKKAKTTFQENLTMCTWIKKRFSFSGVNPVEFWVLVCFCCSCNNFSLAWFLLRALQLYANSRSSVIYLIRLSLQWIILQHFRSNKIINFIRMHTISSDFRKIVKAYLNIGEHLFCVCFSRFLR